MKQLLFSLLFGVCSLTSVLAQSPTFSPIGSKWGFSYQSSFSFGDFQKEAVSDTTIAGRICRKFNTIDRSYLCAPSCSSRQIQGTAFIAQHQDSIFLYNAQQNNFVFLFHFHAQVNDTMLSKQLKYVCMRVGDTLFGGVRLRKWEFKQVCPQFLNTAPLLLVEKVGALNSDWGLPNTCLIDNIYHTLCYFSQSTILFQRNNCISNIEAANLSSNINIAPNPVRFNLTIESTHHFDIIRIFNTQGQLVLQQLFQNGQDIDVSSLSNGIYFLSLLDKDGKSATKRFIKN